MSRKQMTNSTFYVNESECRGTRESCDVDNMQVSRTPSKNTSETVVLSNGTDIAVKTPSRSHSKHKNKSHHQSSHQTVHSDTMLGHDNSRSQFYSRRSSVGSQDQTDKVKTKIMSAWNNVKYGWTLKMKTNFRYDTPIFLMGKCYHRRDPGSGHNGQSFPGMEQFKQDFTSCIWFTYRRSFPRLSQSHITTDCGWGCMLRSGQMLLAQALVLHFLGKDWNLYNQTKEEAVFYRQIIKWFADIPCHNAAPFGIHNLVKLGEAFGKQPGDWHGPSSAAYILKDAMERAPCMNPVLEDICVYVAQDCTIYKEDIIELCTRRPRSQSIPEETVDKDLWRAVIILVPVRLGGEDLNEIYLPCVQSLLANDACLGIIGGRPKHSLNFVGYQDDKLIYMDPHYCQDSVDFRMHDFPIESFHCMSPRKMPINKMDPSCTIGLYFKTRNELEKFTVQSKEFLSPPMQKSRYPMFIFSNETNSNKVDNEVVSNQETYLRVRHLDHLGRERSLTHESEDFVFL